VGAANTPEALTGRLDAQAAMFAARMRHGLLAASVAIGLEVLDELFEPRSPTWRTPKAATTPAAPTSGTARSPRLGGRQVSVTRPRVRTADDAAEASLATYQATKATDLLAEHMVGAMLAKLSTRRYGAALEPVGDLPAKGTSKSTVSAKFVAATAERLAGLNRRPLDDERWLIIFIDGFSFGQHLLVGALGVTAEGIKIPLAVVEGTTENATLCTRLTANLRDRGLDASHGLLFVVDGSKALSKAIRAVWGDKALIARCRLHKERVDRPSGRGACAVRSQPVVSRRRRWTSRVVMTRSWRAVSSVQPRRSASSRRVWMSASWARMTGANSGAGAKLSHCSQMLA
jgi:putative transposase